MRRQARRVKLLQTADVTAWHLLAEFSLNEFLSDRSRSDGLVAGFLSLPLQELDTVPAWAATLEAMLARFAEEVRGHFEQGGRVRVFCQRKVIDDAYFGRPASQLEPAGQRMEGAQAIPDRGRKMNGGWGCYAIEKGTDSAEAAGTEHGHIIEIYVYRESIDTP